MPEEIVALTLDVLKSNDDGVSILHFNDILRHCIAKGQAPIYY